MYLNIDPYHFSYSEIKEAVDVLENGGIAIIPTDSVYALVCKLSDKDAMLKLCKLADRKPAQSKLSVLLSSISEISEFTTPISNAVFRMLKQYLPGPYTFILRANHSIPKMFLSKRKSLGVRIPNNDICQAILDQMSIPLVSASLKNEDEVLEYFSNPEEIATQWLEKVDLIVAGANSTMEPSTIIDCTGYEPELIREGAGKINEI